ncbi:MAG: hypothetical protein ABIA83_00695 [Patescibacteria group bacterium]
MIPKKLLKKIFENFYTEKNSKEFKRAYKEFFECKEDLVCIECLNERPNVEGWFNEWLLFDFKLKNGRSIIEEFIVGHGDSVSEKEFEVANALKRAQFGLFEVLHIDINKGLLLKNLQTGKDYEVKERSATHQLTQGHLMFSRIVQIGDHYEIVSADTISLPVKLGDHLRKTFLKSKEAISPKDVYNIMYSNHENKNIDTKEEGYLKKLVDKDDVLNLDPIIADQELNDFLKKKGILDKVDAILIRKWINSEMEDECSMTYLTMLSGLFPDGLDRDDIDEFMRVIQNLQRTTPQKRLDNKTPQQKVLEDPNREPDIIHDQIPLPPTEWNQNYTQAHQYFSKADYTQAVEEYKDCFISLKDERTTAPEPYRLFANKALAHFAAGERSMGKAMVDIALEMNPNYDFGIQIRARLESGEYDSLIFHGLGDSLRKAKEEGIAPVFRWDSEEMANWTTDQLVDQFETFGISLNQQIFNEWVKDYICLDDLVEHELYPRYTGPKKDEDFVFTAADILFKRWCPDLLYVDKLLDTVENLEKTVYAKKIRKQDLEKQFELLSRFIVESPDELLKHWQTYGDFGDLATLVACFLILVEKESYRENARQLANAFEKRLQSGMFAEVELTCQILEKKNNWQNTFQAILDKRQYELHPFFTVAQALHRVLDYAEEEYILQEAFKMVKEREKKKLQDVDPCYPTIYNAYCAVHEELEGYYLDRNELESANEICKQMREIEKRKEWLDESPEHQALRKRLDDTDKKELNKQLKLDAAWQYYQYLKKFEINFATDTLTETPVHFFRHDGKKIGRNDPCPCGALNTNGKPIKYKKCCGG